MYIQIGVQERFSTEIKGVKSFKIFIYIFEMFLSNNKNRFREKMLGYLFQLLLSRLMQFAENLCTNYTDKLPANIV